MPAVDGQYDQVGDEFVGRGAVVLSTARQPAQRAEDLDVEDRGGLEDGVGVGEQVCGRAAG